MSNIHLLRKPALIGVPMLLASSLIPMALAHELEGRMTGGGSIFCDGVQVTHGFELHCDNNDGTIPEPNNLEVNFSGGNNFHLVALTQVDCIDTGLNEAPPTAGFDTMTGFGVGTFNNEPGAEITFTLTDDGEPGGGVDTASFLITADGSTVLSCTDEFLEQGGNHQAHRVTGNK